MQIKQSHKILLSLLLIAVVPLLYSCGGAGNKTEAGINESKNPLSAQIQSELSGITITITYDTNFAHQLYVVETGTSLPDTSRYSIERGANIGLIHFPCTDQTVSKYVILPNRVSAVIKTKYDMNSYDRTDYVFTSDSLYIINTSLTNAGIYTSSSIYVLPSLDSKYEYQAYMSGGVNLCNLNKKLFLQVLDFCIKNDIKF